MLRPRKRLTKREIKQDKFVTFTLRAIRFVRQNSKKLSAGLLAAIFIIMIGTLFIKHKGHRRSQAMEVLAEAKIAQEAGRSDGALTLYQRVIDNFGRAKSAGEACVALANLRFERGEYERAKAAFRRYLNDYNDDDILSYTSWAGIAACLEEEGNCIEAAQRYRGYTDKHQDSPWAARCLLNVARCLVSANRDPEARMVLQQVIDYYPNSPLVPQARSEMKMLR